MIILNDGSSTNGLKGSSPTETMILNALEKSKIRYEYTDLKELAFELKVRDRIITNSRILNDSAAIFATFPNSSFNPYYWIKTMSGYRLRPGMRPSAAIRDVFEHSYLYSFECVTTVVLVYYKSILDTIRTDYFDRLYSPMIIWGHNFNDAMHMVTYEGIDNIPGDVYYFSNPDYEDPIWMGENSVFLEKNQYFGHGIGIVTHQKMIEALNTLRKPNATRSAFQLNQTTRLDFAALYKYT
ncbi:protein-glutamine gamma-glutamyltransferase [Rossellomorea aquimaris]|uniref:protein-glutamine gamma-glutamyltransferase n=1 Tax=Rossellomorea aquimaris TaxID=189382 RepID=UPI001CD57D9A|nr:protein-glutamine gamma-glutamyltransferase [Rossellomorea aquimaris]MCA1056261.1 protein-glutamine gamma-glutamyltransferase [Rossellomorea aquimaris]